MSWATKDFQDVEDLQSHDSLVIEGQLMDFQNSKELDISTHDLAFQSDLPPWMFDNNGNFLGLSSDFRSSSHPAQDLSLSYQESGLDSGPSSRLSTFSSAQSSSGACMTVKSDPNPLFTLTDEHSGVGDTKRKRRRRTSSPKSTLDLAYRLQQSDLPNPKQGASIENPNKLRSSQKDPLSYGAKAACTLWLATHSGSFPSGPVILALSIAFDAHPDVLRDWFEGQHTQQQEADFKPLTIPATNHDITVPYEVNQYKCKRKEEGSSHVATTSSVPERDKERPFACTLPCGACFKSKDDWRRHEETNFPQRLWHCPVPGCRHNVLFRKDRFKNHLIKQHNYTKVTDQDCITNCMSINSQFSHKCIIRSCNTHISHWKDRIDHISNHLAGQWSPRDWRVPKKASDESLDNGSSSKGKNSASDETDNEGNDLNAQKPPQSGCEPRAKPQISPQPREKWPRGALTGGRRQTSDSQSRPQKQRFIHGISLMARPSKFERNKDQKRGTAAPTLLPIPSFEAMDISFAM